VIRGGGRCIASTIATLSLLAGSATRGKAQSVLPPRVLVMPFENASHDGRIFWLGEAVAVLLTDELTALGADAITRDERTQAFERLQVPQAAVLTDATVIRLGQLVGAYQVIVGSLDLAGDTLVVRARSLALEPGRLQRDVVERGRMPELFGTIQRLARTLGPVSAGVPSDAGRRPPIGAFENYIKGLLAETPATAVGYLNASLKQYPAFDRARVALWYVYMEQGNELAAIEAVQAVPADSPLSRRARFLTGLSELELKQYPEAFAIFKTLADAKPTATVLNNLGVAESRRAVPPQVGASIYYFSKARELDPDDPDCLFNLGYAYWLEQDARGAIYWLREAVRRNPADGQAHFVLGMALSAEANAGEASREKELAKRLSSTFEQWEKRPAAEAVPRGLERVKQDIDLPHARRLETTLATGEQRDQRELARFYLDRGQRLYQQENDHDAAGELNRALFLSPYDAEAHLLLGRIHLRNGRVREAIDALKISLWSAETPQAHVVLGEAYIQAKDDAGARAEAERALALAPGSVEARRLLERIEGR
jgi:tetratricopeptide (TPR) repeat protein